MKSSLFVQIYLRKAAADGQKTQTNTVNSERGPHGGAPRRASGADLGRAFEVALDALNTDRVRTRAAIVALGIAMAIVACLTSLVERGRAATIRSLERAGLANLYLVQQPPRSGDRLDRRLTRADAERVRALAGARAALAIRVVANAPAAAGTPFSAPLYAVSGPLDRVFSARAGIGRLIADLDVERKSPYCVVGAAVPALAKLDRTLGSVLTVAGRTYEIIGVLEESRVESAATGEVPSIDWNRSIVVPLGAEPGPEREADERYPADLAVLAFASVGAADRAASLPARVDPERFGPGGSARVVSPVQTLRQYRQTRRTFDRIVWLVGVLTAASAVLGISNLLSASVLARTREIGLRRAVGARSRDIVLQFRAEGVLLAVAGGGLGLAAGALISALTRERSESGSSISFLSFSALAAGCVVIGILTGIRPSLRASRIDPAAALREG
jgi:putative ABC transport system permease protein